MKILIIVAHPSSKGFSHQVATRYAAGAKSVGHEVEIFDLYKTNLRQDFVMFEDPKDWSKGADVRKKVQDKMAWADQYIIAHPLWWGGPPAILKNFLDQNLTPGFAYKHIARKYIPKRFNIVPMGLLAPRTGRVFITCDGPRWFYMMIGLPFMTIWRLIVLQYCGVRIKSMTLFSQMMWHDEAGKSRWLDKVEVMGRNA